MHSVVKKRKSLQLKVATLKQTVDSHNVTPLTEAAVNEYLNKVSHFRRKNDEIHDDIVELCSNDDEIVRQELEYQASEEPLEKMKITLMELLKTLSAVGPRPQSSSTEVRLPKLELPTFSGDVQQWLSFHDLFFASVHSSTRLSGAQKLQYLKASVKGEAANLIQSIEITDDNFDEAWSKLKHRYQNTRLIIKSHFDRLLSQPSLTQENPTALRKLVDTTNECVRAFQLLKIAPEQVSELLIIHTISKKLDPESRLQWERSLKDDELPKFEDFSSFLDRHARVTMSAGATKPKVNYSKPVTHTSDRKPTAVHLGSAKVCCVVCSGEHFMFKCDDFLNMTVTDRHSLVKNKKLCFNCLRAGHSASDCSSKYKCKVCKSPHHSLLHLKRETTLTTETEIKESQPQVATLFASDKLGVSQVLLSTAIIKVKDVYGKELFRRALLDNGSMSSIITEKLMQKLKLPRNRVEVPISGLGNSAVGTANNFVQLQITSCVKPFTTNINALILPKITNFLPHSTVDYSTWTHISCLKLADPKFFQPEAIDILLGNDICHDIMRAGQMKGPTGTPTALETELGWIIGGKVTSCSTPAVNVHFSNVSTDSILQKFWELEELPRKTFLTPEEKMCENHFATTHSRTETGRFVVHLPFKSDAKQLGESRSTAVRRLQQVERRLEKNPAQRKLYSDVINEYLELRHMEKIPFNEVNSEKCVYYMPHHAVIKESSKTTKLRVVFDASCKSSTNVSLNDNLLIGPRLQDELINILIRFRTYPVAITADINKMYRQFLVHKDDVNFQRIVWRNSPQEPICDYRLLTATFGTASAPYLAVKCVQQLATDSTNEFPQGSSSLLHDLYVDDLMSGSQTVEEAKKLQEQLLKIMSRGQLELRKWSSNSAALLENLPPELRESSQPLCIDEDESVKTLGLQWHPSQDVFKFKLSATEPRKSTKRAVASEIAKNCFDPLGWLSPVTIQAKLILQELWKRNLDWDEELPEDLMEIWVTYLEELLTIEDISIPRCIVKVKCNVATELSPKESLPLDSKSHPPQYTLLGFCDASEKAYSAVVYLQTTVNMTTSTNIVAAKTKVAPLKTQTLPRLELCGAVLLSKLQENIQESLSLQISEVKCYTDSTIVLAWLASPPQRWKTFVANRVSEIQQTIPYTNWNHIRGENNPADCASRGISPEEFLHHPLWWNGPLETATTPATEVLFTAEIMEQVLKEEKKISVPVHHTTLDLSLFNRNSSLSKLQRITTYLLRFVCNLKQKDKSLRVTGLLSVKELQMALQQLIKIVQLQEFSEEIHQLSNKKPLSYKSKILALNPFLDLNGVLRVGGRLNKSSLSIDKKYPILLPRKHSFTQLVVAHYHKIYLHAGPQALLAALQEKYWILCGRDVVRHYVRKCVVCAIHLELVSDMTSDAFLAAMKRFLARRGKPSDMHSDCGSNFVGADKELKQFLQLTKDPKFNATVHHYLANEGIMWHFNPPAAPHFGGLWEAGVKSAKHHLRRIIGNNTLTFEEMTTVFCQVEACLNSRPLTALSSNPDDLSALTPAHFLIGDTLMSVPEPDLTEVPENRLSRWQLSQQFVQHFWNRWSREYLSRLQQRPKWLSNKENIAVGDLMLLKDELLPPLKWKLARVMELFPGKDNLVRVVLVKTEDGVYKRPIVKLCPLPIDTDIT